MHKSELSNRNEIENNVDLAHARFPSTASLPPAASDSDRARQRKLVTDLSTAGIRDVFLGYFEGRGYREIGCFSVLPQNDPTLLFVNSGMAPIKPYFTGEREVQPGMERVCNVQTCIRTNDIESIGDTYHLTMFEMMGNWTFGELSKTEALQNALSLVSDVFRFREHRLACTYFEEDPSLPGVPTDRESKEIWRALGLGDSQIYGLNAEHNFWIAGETGPCGPCTELFVDLGAQPGKKSNEDPSTDSGRFIEIWNAGVFMEYFRNAQGEIAPMRKSSLDAGAGMERWAMILQGKSSVYEIDSIAPILRVIVAESPLTSQDRPARVMTDHVRTATILLAEGVEPSNKNQGYVLRRLIRRAALQAKQFDIPISNLLNGAKETLKQFSHRYHFTQEQSARMLTTIEKEVDKFMRSLDSGERELDRILKKNGGSLSGAAAFKLKESFGLPVEIIKALCDQRSVVFDMVEFLAAEETHRKVSNSKKRGMFQ